MLLTQSNAAKSKVRARIKHVFAAQKGRIGLFIRTIGIKRVEATITLANMAYNLQHEAMALTRKEKCVRLRESAAKKAVRLRSWSNDDDDTGKKAVQSLGSPIMRSIKTFLRASSWKWKNPKAIGRYL